MAIVLDMGNSRRLRSFGSEAQQARDARQLFRALDIVDRFEQFVRQLRIHPRFAAIVELCLPIFRAEGTDREIAGPFQRSSVLKLDRDDVWTPDLSALSGGRACRP